MKQESRRQTVPARTGELSNSSPSNIEYMRPVWPRLGAKKRNFVIAGVSRAQIEPREGKADFSVLDGMPSNHLRLSLSFFPGTVMTLCRRAIHQFDVLHQPLLIGR
jgi:hypothetical protein